MATNVKAVTESCSKKNEHDDQTKCPLCTKPFTDPRLLPCLHTFCLSCLIGASCSAERRDCSTCQEILSSKQWNLQDLPPNTFARRCVELQQVALSVQPGKTTTCAVCPLGGNDQQVVEAKVYCVECDQHLCVTCNDIHRRLKTTSNHTLVATDGNKSNEEEGSKFDPTEKRPPKARLELKCLHHVQERSSLFCTRCNCPICTVCYATKHRNHECQELEPAAVDLRDELETRVQQLTEYSDIYRTRKQNLASERQLFLRNISEVEKSVQLRAQQAKKQIEEQAEELQRKLDEIKVEKVDAVRDVDDGYDEGLESNQRCLQFVRDVLDGGSDGDLVCLYRPIVKRLDSLLVALPSSLKLEQVAFKPTPETTAPLKKNSAMSGFGFAGQSIPASSFTFGRAEKSIIRNGLGEICVVSASSNTSGGMIE